MVTRSAEKKVKMFQRRQNFKRGFWFLLRQPTKETVFRVDSLSYFHLSRLFDLNFFSLSALLFLAVFIPSRCPLVLQYLNAM